MTQTLGSSIMKKTMKFIGLIAMAAVLFSCEKKIDTETVIVDTTPDEAAVDGSLLKSFGATFENQTKVSVNIETGDTSLEIGDLALVFVSSSNYAEYKYNGTAFVPNDDKTQVELSSTASVYYPSKEFVVDGEAVKFIMPGGIKASESLGAIAPMAGVITQKEGDYSVEFKNLASILRVKVTADVNITSVTLSFGESQKYAQNAKFIVDAVNSTMEFSNASGASGTTVSLDPVAKEADVIFLLPTITLPEGLEVTANLTEDNNGGARSYTVTNASTNAPLRNSISKMSFYAGLFSGGAGTSEDPYKIATARDFRNLIKYSKEGCPQCSKNASDFLGANYLQTADINFKDKKMSPISDFDNRFGGTYDGGGNELQNVNIDETGAIAAVFATLNGSGEIKNLTVSGNVTKDGATENSLAAGIVGIVYDNAKITNCTNKATISSSATYTGGIVGRLYGSGSSISQCVNNGNVTSSTSYVGGIAGYVTHGYIVDCFAKGTISGARNTGGLVGYAYAANANVGIFNSVSSADVITSFGEADSGAFIGRATNAGDYYCYIGNCACINGSFTATDGAVYRVAAFIGFTNTGSGSNYDRVRVWNSYTTIQDSEFNVTTSATNNYGGFIGRMNNRNSLCDCYFVCDNEHSAVNNTNVKNLTKISVSQMNGTEDLTIEGPMGQSHTNKTGKFVEILNIGNKQKNGSTPLRAFNKYDFCDWTTTGANSEALTYPVPETLVALGETHYK